MAAFCTPRFYHHHHQHPAASSAAEPIAMQGLFRFLDDLQDNLSLQDALQQSLNDHSSSSTTSTTPKQQQQQKQQQRPLPTFTPRFDISETETAYLLHGDLPGLSKSDVDIDFVDAQTITVRGKIERAIAAAQENNIAENDQDVLVEDAVDASRSESPAPSTITASQNHHQATVEDDFEDLGAAETASNASHSTAASSSSSSANEKNASPKTSQQAQAKQQEQQPQIPQPPKYWISERQFGQFARSFKFRKTVDVSGVSASLENGVLSIVVPKKNESRKIFVQ